LTEVATKPAPTRPARPARTAAPPRRPRRVSGPAPRPARAREPRRRTLAERLNQFLRGLPEHALLDRLVRGRAWIPLLGVMLGGIVAMQVELLKLNSTTSRSIELASALQSRNDILRAEVAADSAPGRIERLGLRMGMIMPGPEAITFLKARSANPRRAATRIQPPNIPAFLAALQATNTATAGSMPILAPSPTPPAPARPAASIITTATTASSTATTATTPTTTTTTPATTSTTATTSTAPPATVP
jgi:hypothetical protein